MDGREENGEGGVEQPGVPTEDTREESIEPQTDEQKEDELLKDEDAIQTARRILGKDKDSETEEYTEETDPSTEKDEATTEQGPKPDEISDEDDVEPPVRLTAEAKQAFKKWPKKAKSEFATAVKQMEGRFTQATQEAATEKANAKHLLEAVRPYFLSKPQLAAKGITESQVVSGLIGNHQILTGENVQARRQKYLEIGQSIGLVDNNGNLIDAEPSETGAVNTNAIQTILNNTLQERLKPVESFIEAQNRIKQEQAADAITADITSVMKKTDSLGNYLYPELHDKTFHGQQVKPLVEALVRSRPGITYGQATEMAVQNLRMLNGQSPQLNPAGLPTNNNTQKKRAAEAGVSVRGRTTGNVESTKLTTTQQEVMDRFPVGGR